MKFFRKAVIHFSYITTGSTVAAATFNSILNKSTRVNKNILWQIIILSILCTIASFILWSKEELSKVKFIIRLVLQYIMINIVMLSGAYMFGWIDKKNNIEIVTLLILILFVYIFVWGCTYKNECKTADKLNEKIKYYNKDKNN